MALANEDRGGLVGAFIVRDGDEVLSITTAGQVVRSPINADFRPTGRSTQGVKFVAPKRATRSPWSPAPWRHATRTSSRTRWTARPPSPTSSVRLWLSRMQQSSERVA